MRHSEQREVTESKQVHVSTTCDRCGAEKHRPGRWPPTRFDEIDRVTIEWQRGTSFPDCGQGETLELDICPACWDEAVLPALRAIGITREPGEYDF